jgi:DNA-binding response OmpR family regulator
MPDTETPKKILIVEDDEFLRDLYIEILQDVGYTVDHAADGEEGYAKLRNDGYDLVLLDIMLPKMDGLTILEKLKADPQAAQSNAKIIVLSNMGQDSAIAKAIGFGAKGYMIKSDYTPDEVINKVREYLTK